MRKSVVAAWALTAALLVAAGGVARAQAQQGPSPSQKWRPTPLNLDAGKTTYGDIGRARMRAGDCAGAIDAFDEAINHSIDPTLYRDRGLCHEKLGHPYPAIDDYQVYLTASPDAPDADDIRIRLRRLLDKVNGRTTSDEDEDETPSSGGASATASGQTSGGSSSSSGSSGGSASASAKVDVKAATHRRA